MKLGNLYYQKQNFNSRPSARGDKKLAENLEKSIISIHAPPRGATALDFTQIFVQ